MKIIRKGARTPTRRRIRFACWLMVLSACLAAGLAPLPAQAQWPDALRADQDADGIDDNTEALLGTNPSLPDSDGDGVWDGLDALPLDPEVSEAANAIYLHGGPFVPSAGLDPALVGISGAQHAVLIQFFQPPSRTEIETIAAQLGIQGLLNVRDSTYSASVPTANLDDLAADASIRWVGAFPLASRMSPELWIGGVPTDARTPSGGGRFDLSFSPEMTSAEIETLLTSYGASEVEMIGPPGAVEAIVDDANLLGLLLNESRLLFVELVFENNIESGIVARSHIRVDTLDSSTLNLISREPYTGSEIVVAVVEKTTPDLSHPELGDSSASVWDDSVSLGTVHMGSVGGHSTAVAGIITGNGVLDATAMGVAPESQVRAYSWYSGRKGFRTVTEDSIALGAQISNQSFGLCSYQPCGTLGHYGFMLFPPGFYRNVDAEVDRYSWGGSDLTLTPLLSVWSAGNEGPGGIAPPPSCQRVVTLSSDPNFGSWDCIGGWSVSKNSITVGSVNGACRALNNYSGRGPTDDGRIKPEVVAPGTSIYTTSLFLDTNLSGGFGQLVADGNPPPTSSCSSFGCMPSFTNNFCTGACVLCSGGATGPTCCVDPTDFVTTSFDGFEGTSAATPMVSGLLASALQAWVSLGLPAEPRPATLKALLIQTARDLQNNGDGSFLNDGPSNRVGFGLVDGKRLFRLIERHAEKPLVFEDNVTDRGQVREIKFSTQAEDIGDRMRITIAWDDTPGYKGSPLQLNNDFDITLIAPNGWIYHPWVVDHRNPGVDPICTVDSTGSATASELGPCVELAGTAARDRLNPVEQIFVPEITGSQTGQWTLRVENIWYHQYFDGIWVPEANFSVVLPFNHAVACGETITADRVLYEDLDCSAMTEGSAITIGANNVDLNCSGFHIIGPGGTAGARIGTGVALESVSNATVTDCEISGFGEGIRGSALSSPIFSGNNIHENDKLVVLEAAQGASLSGNSLWTGYRFGVSIDAASDGIAMSENLFALSGSGGGPYAGAGLTMGTAQPTAPADRMDVLLNDFISNRVGIYNKAREARLDQNRVCYSAEQGLAQHGLDALLTQNLACHNGAFDIEGSLLWPSDPASDQNACTHVKDYSDASALSGCLNPCGLACEVGSSPPEVETIGWDWFGIDELAPELIIDVHDSQGSPPPTPSPLGAGVTVAFVPGEPPVGPNYVIRQSSSSAALNGIRRKSLKIARLDSSTAQYVAVSNSVVSIETGTVSAVVTDPGVYAVIGDACDVWIDQASAPQTALAGSQLESGDVICLDPDVAYSNVAFVLDGAGGTANLTLDCQGASVSGAGVCVDVASAPGARVESCRFEACGVGVRVANAPGAVIEQNEFLGPGVAIEMTASAGAAVLSNAACEAGSSAFQNDGSGTLDGNVCSGGDCSFECVGDAPAVPSASEFGLWLLAGLLLAVGASLRAPRSPRLPV